VGQHVRMSMIESYLWDQQPDEPRVQLEQLSEVPSFLGWSATRIRR
jgi:hypothetical protein